MNSENVKWIPLAGSSNVEAYAYDEKTAVLQVRFKGDKVYAYMDVPKETVNAFKSSPSPGGFIHTGLRGFKYKRIQ